MKIKSAIFLLSVFLFTGINYVTSQDFKEVEKTFQMNKDGKVTVDTYKGEIKIETWDKAEVHVYAKIVPDDVGGFWSTSSEKQLDRVNVEFDVTSEEVRIKSNYSKKNSWFGNNTMAFVNYKIQMPKTARLNIKDYKSKTKIFGLQAPMKLETYKGEVKVVDISGPLDLETYKGQVDVEFAKFTDESRFDTYKGEIEISVPQNSAFTIDADFNKKTNFSSEFDITTAPNKRKHHFRQDINGGGTVLKLSSDKGEIRLYSKDN